MKATQRPEYLSSSSSSPKPKKAAPPKLPLDIAREEQALAALAASLSPQIDASYKIIEAALKAAYDAQRKFLVDWGYVPRSTGSYEDSRYFYVHPLYVELYDAHYHSWGWEDGYSVVPDWAVIEVT